MDNKKIVWLASYPKSGNTWFRAFLTALLNDGEVDINELKTDGIFSSRQIFDSYTDLNSTYLYDEEAKLLQSEVFMQLAIDCKKEQLFVKIHDAYTYDKSGKPMVPEEITKCAIYFIRNPLDVAGSLANHNNSTLDEAIKLMNNSQGSLATQSKNRNINIQFRQLMLSWSEHVESWTTRIPFPVLILRYEDMLLDTLATFTKATEFLGIVPKKERIEKALNATSFNRLQQQEMETGFKEKNEKNKIFFRRGEIGNWKTELSEAQVNNLINSHSNVMRLYDYL